MLNVCLGSLVERLKGLGGGKYLIATSCSCGIWLGQQP